MSRQREEQEEARTSTRSAWLPAFFAILLSVIGLYVAIFELSPAFQEHREVRAALRKQLDANNRLQAEISAKEKKDRSLREDPQAIPHELDQRGLLQGGEDLGTSSDSTDRGQSQH